MHHRRAVMVHNFGLPQCLPIILIVLILDRRYGACGAFAKNPIDESICTRYDRINGTKQVTYAESYYGRYSQIFTRLNFRTEEIMVWKTIEMCCHGYKPEGKEVKCIPICQSDCHNGTCLRPNVCTCDSGYRTEINKLTGYSECVADCPSGCRGGNCIMPNKCSCNVGYISAKDQASCEPTCAAVGGVGPQGCVDNASCIAPNECQCDKGYATIANLSSLLNESSISSDFEKSVKPMKLADKPTFNTSSVTCRPICEPECDRNSSCVAPNKCQCSFGYSMASLSAEQPTNGSRCLPNCKQKCFNGYCGSPDKCTCHEGYKPHHWLNEDLCEPICRKQCVNAKCTGPDNCDCLDGYEKLMLRNGEHRMASENMCIPVCHGQCPNGSCVSPGHCHCNEGYILDYLGSNGTRTDIADSTNGSNLVNYLPRQFCRPFCEPVCPKGSLCIAPNRCQSETSPKLVGGMVGTIVLLGLVVGIVAVICMVRRKIIKIGAFGAISGRNVRTMEQLETMESPLHTVDS